MNARRESKERNLTWRIQEDSNYSTLSEHFLELNLCILYFVLKLGKSEIQCFKWCMIRSKIEEVRAIGSRSHQAEGQFRRLRNQPLVAKSAFGCEITRWWLRNGVLQLAKFHSHLAHLRNPPECFQIFATDIFRFFASDIWCLNPHFLLVIHLLMRLMVA